MKLLICITLLVACANASDPIDDDEVQFIPEDGPIHIVLHKLVQNCVHESLLDIIEPGIISLNFNDFENNINLTFPIEGAGEEILNIPDLQKSNKFVFIIPGYTQGITNYSLNLIQENFRNLDTYVIILNDLVYTNIWQTKRIVSNYERAVRYTNPMGRALANVFVTLTKNGISTEDVHCIGHSIGAHVCGKAGETHYNLTGTKIARITALDASGPCFENKTYHVQRGQADFVDLYHCNAFELASSRHYGNASIFVNNGIVQPRCFTPKTSGGNSAASVAAYCSHMACQNFYFMTVGAENLFPTSKCESYRKLKKGVCKDNEKIDAGYWIPSNASGLYYTLTGDKDITPN